MRALIAEEEPTKRSVLSRTLKEISSDIRVTEVRTGADARANCRHAPFDVAFLDTDLAGERGLEIAADLKRIQPLINIVMVSDDAEEALASLRAFVSGYIVRPVTKTELTEVLANLRNPVRLRKFGLTFRCFGDFEVFYDDRPVRFGRAKSKELLAYLIDRRGATVTGAQLCAVLWEDQAGERRTRDYFHHVVSDLRETLQRIGCEEIFLQERNAYSVREELIDCDYYRALQQEPRALLNFEGEYMSQYSWAETRLGGLLAELDDMTEELLL
ncbi:MAG: response regulator [Lachnospiraceae bacterium]|nr:response regulator [Lachnospiraceae bacterium]